MPMTMTRFLPRRGPVTKGLLALLLAFVLLLTALQVTLAVARHQLDSRIGRVSAVFTGLHDRPVTPQHGPGAGALNILVLGTDRRSAGPTTGSAATDPEWLPGAQRSDTMMVVHIGADRAGATVVSLPRDAWVEVPGHGHHKLNAAFSLAGPSLAVATVEQLTDIRIDHLAVVDQQGLVALVDLLGGVDVTVPDTVSDPRNKVVWERGEHHLDGDAALLFARHRYGLPRGDLDRIERQHQVLRSLLGSVREAARGLDVRRLHGLVGALTDHVSVDEGWEAGAMVQLLLDLRHLDGQALDFRTAPVRGVGWEGDQSVVWLDDDAGRELWADLRADRPPVP